jgi:hypothetical protein
MQDLYIMPVELEDTGVPFELENTENRQLSVNQSYRDDCFYGLCRRQYSEYNLAHPLSQNNQITCIAPNIPLEKRVVLGAAEATS